MEAETIVKQSTKGFLDIENAFKISGPYDRTRKELDLSIVKARKTGFEKAFALSQLDSRDPIAEFESIETIQGSWSTKPKIEQHKDHNVYFIDCVNE